MDLTSAIDWLGDDKAVALGGFGGGVLFGAFAFTAWIALSAMWAVLQGMKKRMK